MQSLINTVLKVFSYLDCLLVDFNFSNLSENVKADLSNFVSLFFSLINVEKLKVYSIDVECVATGTRHCDRDVAKIAIVDCLCDVVFESYVKPEKEVVSYLTQLTGIKYTY